MAQTLKWTGLQRSPARFQERSWGWGTTAQRNALTRWQPNGFFMDTTQGTLYQNTNQNKWEAPVWASRVAGSDGDHTHANSTQGGKLDADVTIVVYNSTDFKLIELCAI